MSARGVLLTAGGLGLLRPAPGTWGSTPPIVLVLVLLVLLGAEPLTPGDLGAVNGAIVALGAVFAVACIAGGRWAEERFGGKDPSSVVADEVAGQCIALLALPWRPMAGGPEARWNILLALTAFALFRLFDITKPPPARGLQRLPAGWGILVDDLIAGAYALAVSQLLFRVAWPALASPAAAG